MERRIIVFGTRDIASDAPAHAGERPVFDGFVGRHRVIQYSTGRLERALAEGLEIHVCSIRPAFGAHDRWWLALVPPERVHAPVIPPGRRAVKEIAWLLECGPWKRLFDALGLPWDDGWEREEGPRSAAGGFGLLLGGHFPASKGVA